MIDPGDYIVDLRHRNADVSGKLTGGMLYTMAKTDRRYFSLPGQGPAIHRHRIDIVEMDYVRTTAFHFPAHGNQNRHRTQGAHDPSNPQRICNGLPQAIFFGNLKISDGARTIATDLDHVDSVGSAIDRAPTIGSYLDFRNNLQLVSDSLSNYFGCPEPFCVDVEKTDLGICQLRKRQN